MKRLVLTAKEARDLAAGALAEIRRPFKQANDSVPAFYRASVGGSPDRAKAVFPDGSGKGWIAWWGGGQFTAEQTARLYPGNQGVPCPFGTASDLLWCAETWALETLPPDGERVVWQSDRGAAWHELPSFLGKPFYLDSDHEPASPWKRAATMPRWASRFTLRLAAVRVERVGDVWTWIGAVERVEGAK